MNFLVGLLVGFISGALIWHHILGYLLFPNDSTPVKSTCRCSSPSCREDAYDPQANPNIKPTEKERPNCRYPRWNTVDKYWLCCHGGINCGSCGAWPNNCKESNENSI